jgi:redox-sensitive bicupin YhaK (pirin superfamily)
MSRYRSVEQITAAPAVMEGAGVLVHRAFPNNQISELDPFLLLDHMGPMTLKPGEAKGFPDHPHRGFETVTYILAGEFHHHDSFGHHGELQAGDVQWMTAGSGLVHSEVPAESLVKNGGKLEGFQLWVNLPKKDKMKQPHYQEIKSNLIPRASDGGVSAKVVAGEALGAKGAVETHIPIQYLHFFLKPGAKLTHVAPANLNAMVYVINGKATVAGESVPQFHLAALANDGDSVELGAANEGAEFLFLAAEPIGEPVARYGPFVMNTREELQQAFDDYRSGKMGTITTRA